MKGLSRTITKEGKTKFRQGDQKRFERRDPDNHKVSIFKYPSVSHFIVYLYRRI